MKEMALDEIEVARANIETLEERLNVMMLPKDPNDKATAFLEIRAGTGGDEAAIFRVIYFVCIKNIHNPKVGK